MTNKKLLITNVLNSILSATAMNFQEKLGTLLRIACKRAYNLDFKEIEPTNGDGKNDGWIPQKNIFFAMFSPNDASISQINQINNKLNDDLDGLCKNLYVNNYWNKELSRFYLIVNTHDKNLPADKEMVIDNTIKKIKEKYGKEFYVEVLPAKDIKEFLYKLDDEVLVEISNNLDIYGYVENFTIPDILDFVDEYTEYLATQSIEECGSDYSRINIEEKINLNGLYDRKEYILNLIDASDKIDNYLSFINSNGMNIENYIKIKNYIVSKYNNLSKKYKGKDLYDKLLDELIFESLQSSHVKILEAAVVNTFIKCDIFEKED